MQHYKKYAAALALGALFIGAAAASAQTSASSTAATGSTVTNQYPAPMVVDIGNNGSALIRGTVASVGANSLTLNSWGGAWTVQVATGGTVASTGNVLSGIKTGDFVGVDGTVTGQSSMTVNGTFVRDWTTNPYRGMNGTGTSGTSSMTGGANIPASGNGVGSGNGTSGASGTSASGNGTGTSGASGMGTGLNGTGTTANTTGSVTGGAAAY